MNKRRKTRRRMPDALARPRCEHPHAVASARAQVRRQPTAHGHSTGCMLPPLLLLAGAAGPASDCCTAGWPASEAAHRRCCHSRQAGAGRVGAYTRTPSGSTRPRMSADSFSTCRHSVGTERRPHHQGNPTADMLRLLAHVPCQPPWRRGRARGAVVQGQCRLQQSAWSAHRHMHPLPPVAVQGRICTLRAHLHTNSHSLQSQCAPGRPGSSWPRPSRTRGWPARGTAQHPPSARGRRSERGRHSSEHTVTSLTHCFQLGAAGRAGGLSLLAR